MEGEITAKDRQAYRKIFDQWKNADGVIGASQLGDLLRYLKFDPSEQDLMKAVQNLDKDESGFLEFEEFIAMVARVRRVKPKEELIRNAFKFFDRDGDGSVTPKEFKDFMTNCGSPLSDVEVNELIELGDANGDGKLQCEEFVNVLLRFG